MSLYCTSGFKGIIPYTPEQMEKMHTRQLLKELRRTHSYGCECCWGDEDWKQLYCYRNQLKAVLATREHIPNKQESKALRKARKKKGN